MKRIFLIVILCVITVTATAQELDINGLIINEYYTNSQILSSINNTPSRVDRWNDEFGDNARYIFIYGPGQTDYEYVSIHGENGVSEFSIDTPNNFSLFNGQIKVGDSITKFNQLGNGKLIKRIDRSNGYYYKLNNLYDPIRVYVDLNNKITSLYYIEQL